MPIIFENLKKNKYLRILLILINDFFILNSCLYISYFIRLEYFINIFEIKETFIFSNILYFFIFFIFRINKSFFRFFNEQSVILYGKYILSYSVIFTIFVLSFYEIFFIPRSLVIIYPILIFFVLVLNRYIISSLFKNITSLDNKYSVIFGINTNIDQNILSQFNVKYYVTKNNKNVNRNINGIPIIDINDFIKKYYKIDFSKILIFDQNLFDKYKFKLRDKIINEEIQVQKISYNHSNLNLSPYFDFNYFFNRKSKILKISNIYKQKVILITGAGGSIGTGILSQLLRV